MNWDYEMDEVSGSPETSGGRMRPSAQRKFTLVDAMVLVAALGVALVPMRDLYGRVADSTFPLEETEGRSPDYYFSWAAGTCAFLRPLVITSSAALWLARLRRPRPSIHRVFRQPGMAAMTAVLASFIVEVLQLLTDLLNERLLGGEVITGDSLWLDGVVHLQQLCPGKAVLAVWIVLRLARLWRAERSWIDRAGRSLGCYCLVETAVFGGYTF
jgi:hypothetical protein